MGDIQFFQIVFKKLNKNSQLRLNRDFPKVVQWTVFLLTIFFDLDENEK